MKSAENIIMRLSYYLNLASCAALTGLMLLITANVILRAVFKAPIQGTYDLTGFLTAIVIGCGLAYCALDNGHIEISYFYDKIGQRLQLLIGTAGRVLSFVILSTYTYSLFALAVRLMNAGEVSVTTKTPLAIIVFILAICFLVFALAVLLKLFERRIATARKGDES